MIVQDSCRHAHQESACSRNTLHPSFYMEEVWCSALQRALQTPHVAAAHEASHSHAPQSEAMPRHVMQLHSL